MIGVQARSDPFALGVKAFAYGAARSSCPFPAFFFEGRHWLLGWDYERSRAAVHQFGAGEEEET